MFSNLKIFYSTIEDGNMNTNSSFYPEGMTKDEITKNFYVRRLILGRTLGFDGSKILIPSQKQFPNITGKTEEKQRELLEKYYFSYPNGKSIQINKELIEKELKSLEEKEKSVLKKYYTVHYDDHDEVPTDDKINELLEKGYQDYYEIDLPADILMIDHTMPGVSLAYPVADCPVVFAEDIKNGVTAMAHCGGEYIDRELPGQIIDALTTKVSSKPEDIKVTVGPHVQAESYTYDCMPRWIKNEEKWKNSLNEDTDGLLHINMKRAIINQLIEREVRLENIFVSNIDTKTDPRFYSNSNSKKPGRFYTGCFYSKNQDLVLTKTLHR